MAGTSGRSLGKVEHAAAASTAAERAPRLAIQAALRSQIRRLIALTLEPASLAQHVAHFFSKSVAAVLRSKMRQFKIQRASGRETANTFPEARWSRAVIALMSVAANACQIHGLMFAKRKPTRWRLGAPLPGEGMLGLHDHKAEMNRRAQVRHFGVKMLRDRNNATRFRP